MKKLMMAALLGLGFVAACGGPEGPEVDSQAAALCYDPEGCPPPPPPPTVIIRARGNGEPVFITVGGRTIRSCAAGTQCEETVLKGSQVGVWSIRDAYATPRISATGMTCRYESFFNYDLGVPQTKAWCERANVQTNVSATISW